MTASDYDSLWCWSLRLILGDTLCLGTLAFLLTLGAGAAGAQSIRFEHCSEDVAHSLSVVPPWQDGGRLIITFPERLLEGKHGSVNLLGDKGENLRAQWQVSTDGSYAMLVQELKIRGVRIEVIGQVVRKDVIRLTVEIVNKTRDPLVMATSSFFCRYASLSGFESGAYTIIDAFPSLEQADGLPRSPVVRIFDVPRRNSHLKDRRVVRIGRGQVDRTFLLGREEGSAPLFDVTVSAVTPISGRNTLVLAWTPGNSAPARDDDPSLHVNSCFGTIAPHDKARAKGLLLLTDRPLEPEMLWISRTSGDIAHDITRPH